MRTIFISFSSKWLNSSRQHKKSYLAFITAEMEQSNQLENIKEIYSLFKAIFNDAQTNISSYFKCEPPFKPFNNIWAFFYRHSYFKTL